MRAAPSVLARPAWYDRNPVSRVNDYVASLAPHTLTERISYACPAGKKAMVEAMQVRVERLTAPTTPDDAWAVFYFTPSGGTEKRCLSAHITEADNAAKDKDSSAIGAQLTLFPGDVLSGRTADFSTGGICQFDLYYKLTEFDA